jgi:hypothetical protein
MQRRLDMLSPRVYPAALLFLIAAAPPLAAQSVVLPLADAPFASLAVAAAKATTLRREVKQSGHASRLYTRVDPPRPAWHPRAVTLVAAREAPDPARRPRLDPAYWHDRRQILTTRLSADRRGLEAMVVWARGLDQAPWDDRETELTRRTAIVESDIRALQAFDLDAHRAGVPPGWLIPE